MEKEIIETYYFKPSVFNQDGRRKSDGKTFRDYIKECEIDFHTRHSAEYAYNLYANSQTMALLARSNNAAPFLIYGMDLTKGNTFDPIEDPYINHVMDKSSNYVCVFGIDSAFMTEFDESGYPVLNDDSNIFPLTLLVDDNMRNDEFRLSVPTADDGDESENVIINAPIFEYA